MSRPSGFCSRTTSQVKRESTADLASSIRAVVCRDQRYQVHRALIAVDQVVGPGSPATEKFDRHLADFLDQHTMGLIRVSAMTEQHRKLNKTRTGSNSAAIQSINDRQQNLNNPNRYRAGD